MKNENLVGRVAVIKTGCYAGDWGVIKHYDGELFHLALWGGLDMLVYDRSEITIRRKSKKSK